MWPSRDKWMQDGFVDISQSKKQEPLIGNGIVPLMIGHLLGGSLETFNLWGTPIHLMQIVAIVRKVERVSTKVSYEIFDETGSIMAHQWNANNVEDSATVPVGSYARIIGSLREQGDSRHVVIVNIQKIDSLTDVFEHILEVTYACMKGEEILSESTTTESACPMDQSEDPSLLGMTEDQTSVYQLIHSWNDTPTGIERNILKMTLPLRLRNCLDDILDFLASEGRIYTTCTENHFKTT